jgi:hypothetical protein
VLYIPKSNGETGNVRYGEGINCVEIAEKSGIGKVNRTGKRRFVTGKFRVGEVSVCEISGVWRYILAGNIRCAPEKPGLGKTNTAGKFG